MTGMDADYRQVMLLTVTGTNDFTTFTSSWPIGSVPTRNVTGNYNIQLFNCRLLLPTANDITKYYILFISEVANFRNFKRKMK
jgi:hypothetical protein